VIHAGTKWAGLLLAGLAIAGIWWYASLPDGAEFAHANPLRTSMMQYRDGGKGARAVPIAWVPLSLIAPALRHAVVIAEDAHFYRHRGIDWEATWSALQRDWRERRFSHGGSTITQQLAKNLYLKPRKTIWRKATEALIALRMERHLSKTRLLELYLNVVEWGRGVYGAEAAAQHYFGKSAAALTIDEAAWLAAILPAPLRYEQHPAARSVVARASTIKRYLEQQLTDHPPSSTPPELPPVPPENEEESSAPPPELQPSQPQPSQLSNNAVAPQQPPPAGPTPDSEPAPPPQQPPLY
jgi:monofunctional biosynthetic peptidoglycan transglycosylase